VPSSDRSAFSSVVLDALAVSEVDWIVSPRAVELSDTFDSIKSSPESFSGGSSDDSVLGMEEGFVGSWLPERETVKARDLGDPGSERREEEWKEDIRELGSIRQVLGGAS
jgi:hypothetical protein